MMLPLNSDALIVTVSATHESDTKATNSLRTETRQTSSRCGANLALESFFSSSLQLRERTVYY
jgi:hypothetical protein